MRRDENTERRHPSTRFVAVLVLVSSSVLATSACTGTTGGARHAPRRATAAAGATTAPPPVVASSAGDSGATGGRAGAAPVVPPGSHPGAVLPDRTLTVDDVVRAPGTSAISVSIRVDVAIRNPGAAAIVDDGTSYRLIGPEGDVFAPMPGRSASPGTVDAHTTRRATISFELPVAATSSLQLLYRPDPGTQAVMIPLHVG